MVCDKFHKIEDQFEILFYILNSFAIKFQVLLCLNYSE